MCTTKLDKILRNFLILPQRILRNLQDGNKQTQIWVINLKKNRKELPNIKVGLSITANSLLGSIKTRWSGQSIFSSAEG